jgi:hypothetical protein
MGVPEIDREAEGRNGPIITAIAKKTTKSSILEQ